MDKDLILSGQGDNILLICAKDGCDWSRGYPLAEPLHKVMDEGVLHTREEHPSADEEIRELARQLHTVADNAVDHWSDELFAEGASRKSIVAFEKAVEGRACVEVLVALPEELEGFRSPQQAFFTLLAGPEYEGMGLPMVVESLSAGLNPNTREEAETHDFQWGRDRVQRCTKCKLAAAKWTGESCPGK